GFNQNEDNLYLVGGEYNYWAEEKVIDVAANNAVLSAVRTTYNKFHLLIEEQILREGTRTIRTVAYNVVPGLFPAQPANLHLPRLITTCYSLVAGGMKRATTVAIETDDYGNELSCTEPSGVRTEYSYYPIAGEPGKCPADPHGLFQRYLKQEKIIPADATAAPRITQQTHTQVRTAQGDYFVLRLGAARDGAVQTLHTYHEAAGDFSLNGRLRSNTTTIDNLAQVTDFTYTFEGDTMTETRRFKGREAGQWLDSVRMLSLTNRRVLALKNPAGVRLELSFDVTGRLTSESTAPGGPQNAGRQYAYHYASASQQANLVTTDALGNKVITYFDGMGRQVSTAQVLDEDTLRPISSRRYDGQGRCVEETCIDYLGEADQRALKTLFAYNAWGNPSRTTHPDGRVLIDEYDPLHHLKKAGVRGQAQWETTFNQYDQPARMIRVGAAGERLEMETRTYDGLGRCTTVVNARQTTTAYTYDAFDRVVNIRETPSDGTAPRERVATYMAGTSEALVSAISMDAKRLGTSTYDSLGRLKSQTRGLRDAPGYAWEYPTNSVNPSVFISPRGDRQVQIFDEQLDVLTEARMPGFAPMLFSHDPRSGALISSQMSGFKHELTYDNYGHPSSDVQTADGKVLTQNQVYSPNGRLLRHTSADGQTSAFEYDALGRLDRMLAGAMVMTNAYDDVGRLTRVSTTQTDNATAVDAKITFDAWGRESSRTLDVSARTYQRIASTYHPDGLLATRRILDAQEQLVIGEIFTYDGYGRLSEYRCEGKEFPVDRLGRGVIRQCFQHDGLDNITQVDTYFADGTHDVSERSFTYNDPTQLSQVTHTHPAQTRILIYDVAGNLLEGAPGRVFTFNALDQLTAVQTETFTYSYQYDAEFRQILAARGSEPAVMLAYTGDRLDALVEGNKKVHYWRGADTVLARTGGVDGEQQHLVDASGSVRAIAGAGQPTLGRHYTPYGNAYVSLDGKARTMADLQVPAFNGERLDIPANLYHLGNGRRAYDPELMIFLSPDPLSPFGEGGINSYAYCACDPLNRSDPEGLFLNSQHWLLTFAFL
ncbi:RHS repeat-associated core domain-containing protein, partial [Pseudomonas sp.]|uniref:RHS repeat-associated core domain-containing protein n=1 Tax=Pseudomonas sp. TaxID=306 RepID=UPI00260CDBBF